MNSRLLLRVLIGAGLLQHILPPISQAQSLDGNWEITAVIDDGRVVEPTNVLLNYAADGRVVIRGQTVELIVPMTYQRKRLPFVADSSQSPMTVDLAGRKKRADAESFWPARIRSSSAWRAANAGGRPHSRRCPAPAICW